MSGRKIEAPVEVWIAAIMTHMSPQGKQLVFQTVEKMLAQQGDGLKIIV